MVSFHSSGILQKRLFQFWGIPIILEKWIDVATRSCNAYPCKDTQKSPSCWRHASDPPKVVERTAPGLLAHHPDAPEPWDRIAQAFPTAFGTTHAGEIQKLWDKPLVAGFERKWIWSMCLLKARIYTPNQAGLLRGLKFLSPTNKALSASTIFVCA